MRSSQKLDIALIEYVFRNKLEKQLWIYCIMRLYSGNRGGHIPKALLQTGLSRRQLYRYISDLVKLGWVTKTNYTYKITSIHIIKQKLDITSRLCIEYDNDILSTYKTFQQHIFAAKITQCLRTQKKYIKKNSQPTQRGSVEEQSFYNEPVYYHKANQLSVSLIAKFFGLSKFKAHQLKHACKASSLIRFNAEFDIIPFFNVDNTYSNYGITKYLLPNGSIVNVKRRSDLFYSNLQLTKRYKSSFNYSNYETSSSGSSDSLNNLIQSETSLFELFDL